MKVQLFGVGTLSKSPAITAQRRIGCYVDIRKEEEKTHYVLIGFPGFDPFVTSLGLTPSRGMWSVNTLPFPFGPVMFSVHGSAVYSINNSAIANVIGNIGTSSGTVSMVDDGTFLVIVDGQDGWVYNMITGTFVQIVDGNFTANPGTVTWQDNYFIVTDNLTRQFQLSQITPSIDPTVWPAVQINFAGSGAAPLKAGIADHNVLILFSDVYTEFWQDTGSPDFPYAKIPQSAAEFGLTGPFSMCKFDNSLAGVFHNTMGGANISRMNGFSLRKISDSDIDGIISNYSTTQDAEGYAFMLGGHPMYVALFPSANQCWMFDGLSNVWTELQDSNGNAFVGKHFVNFNGRLLISNRDNADIYELNQNTYTNNGGIKPFEVISKHIWNDDKYIGISRIQVEFEQGVGTVTGQGVNPVVDLHVSKDGGNTFTSVGFSSIGAIGEFTQRAIWNSLGAARDWVLKLRVTDPVKVIITGASAEMQGAPF